MGLSFFPEYGDFQVALEQLAEKNVDVLFVIPPVNKRWSDYTGLSQDMLQQVARKLKYQLQEQGFTNIADSQHVVMNATLWRTRFI